MNCSPLLRLVPALLGASCAGAPSSSDPSFAPAAGASWALPAGCERSLAGEYQHVLDSTFRYHGEDDGGTLWLRVVRTASLDGGELSAEGSGSVISLRRSNLGFRGSTRSTFAGAAGVSCPVEFDTEAVACDADVLKLRSASRASIDTACRPSSTPPPKELQELRRVSPRAHLPSPP